MCFLSLLVNSIRNSDPFSRLGHSQIKPTHGVLVIVYIIYAQCILKVLRHTIFISR